jgi:hypothetical protein
MTELGTVRQLAWVVRDIDAAMDHWSRVLGVGPWFHKPRVGVTRFRHQGREAAARTSCPTCRSRSPTAARCSWS